MTFHKVKITGSGKFLPGVPVPFEETDRYLGAITDAPPAVAKWLSRIKPVMKEMLDIGYYHYAIDPETRKFTEDNVTMAVKAARQAIEMARIKPEDIQFIAYGSASAPDANGQRQNTGSPRH